MTKEIPVSDDPTQSHPQPVTWSAPTEPAPPVTPPTPSLDPVRPTVSSPRRSSSGRWLNLLLGLAAAVAIGGVAFAVGRGTAPAPAAAVFGQGFPNGGAFPGGSFDPTASGGPGRGNGGVFGAGGLTVQGTVESVTGDTLTIKTENGRSVQVTLGSDTKYHQQAAGTASDVKAGSTVSVQLDLAGRGQGNGNQGGNGTTGGATGTASEVTVIP